MLADSVSATLAALAMIPPLTTFSQNAGVISLTRNASRISGFVCAAFLFIMGVVSKNNDFNLLRTFLTSGFPQIGKFVAVFVALPSPVLGGFTAFIFSSVFISGIRVLACKSILFFPWCFALEIPMTDDRLPSDAQWNRRTRFIATCAFAPGMASLVVPSWFSYVFTYSRNNKGLSSLIQAVVLVVEEPYLIAALIAIILNGCLPPEGEEQAVSASSEAERRAWNQHTIVEEGNEEPPKKVEV